MTKKCLIEIYGVRLILKYDKTIVLEDVLSTLSKKCNLKTQLSGVTYYDLMIELVNWNKEEHFDRLGTKKDPNNIRIPIKKGRDVGILIEVAVLDYKLRKNGEDYIVSPYALSWVDDNYYLVSHHAKYNGELTHYRIDRMSDINILDMKRTSIKEVTGDQEFNVAKYL